MKKDVDVQGSATYIFHVTLHREDRIFYNRTYYFKTHYLLAMELT